MASLVRDQPAVAAGLVNERLAGAGLGHADDLADHDAVVPAAVDGRSPATPRRAPRMGLPVTVPGWWLIVSSWPASGRPRVASQRAVFSESSSSTETDQAPAASTVS